MCTGSQIKQYGLRFQKYSLPCFTSINIHPIDMPQCLDADSPAFSNSDRPTKDTVGTMVSGVTNLSIFPTRPESNK